MNRLDRRAFLKLIGIGSIVTVTGIPGRTKAAGQPEGGFKFLQISDTHWGFNDATVNPDYAGTLKKGVAAVNSLKDEVDFIVFTGDLTHTTDDSGERRKRMAGFQAIVKDLKNKNIRYLAGEHDASLDNGEAFHDFFGKSFYTFDHKGVHFIALDNVSDPRGMVGDSQIDWLAADLKPRDREAPVIVLTHRPLFDLYPQWDWATRDGARVVEMLMPFKNVTVFYGHIHQEHHHMTGQITHHAARGMMYPLPAPGSVPKRAPVPWDASQPYRGIGFRRIDGEAGKTPYTLTEFPLK